MQFNQQNGNAGDVVNTATTPAFWEALERAKIAVAVVGCPGVGLGTDLDEAAKIYLLAFLTGK